MSDISFVCTSDKENDGRLSNAVFKMPPEKEQNCQPNSDRSCELQVQKKLDFSRFSNSKASLINNSDNLQPRNYHPLTQREKPMLSSRSENPFKLEDP
jgi:hypothetical protein